LLLKREAINALTQYETTCTMSNIYTANSVEAKAIQHPEFTKRDLKGLTSGQLEKIHMVGVPGGTQLAYDGYIRNLPAFLHATAIGSKVTCSHNW